ncbi:RagB/SusD family nutrient uptake outer membrane protein [Pedobacter sp.]|uniref:RagB/SusD family nutrient uptake outer membrane protein n=1 Tax=Pedobacter sp. TaxID=1411316 RepID=UPI003C596FB0
MKTVKKDIFIIILLGWCIMMALGCKKFLDVPLPTDKFAAEGAYQNDNSTGAVITGIISAAASSPVYGSANNFESIGLTTALYSDDLKFIQNTGLGSGATNMAFYYTNALTSANGVQWSLLYRQLYSCNLAIENIEKNKNILNKYNQWLGEALFLRAFTFFDLTNLYGDVPLAISSDYEVNNSLARAPKAEVYAQVIKDLKRAEDLLGTNYLDGTGNISANRVRPNQFAAAALLARVYLYTGDYANAEIAAARVIGNTAQYQLLAPSIVFTANSKETIWSLAPISSTAVRDYFLYNNGAPVVSANQAALAMFNPAAMSQPLLDSFEQGDLRFSNWVVLRTTTSAPLNGQFYFPDKYKSRVNGVEYNVMLRLAEQFLIRAEARLNQNNISGAVGDLNLIRQRARPSSASGLMADYPSTLSREECLNAILKERRCELFTESAHRFYDLKRLGRIDQVMGDYAAAKGTTWSTYKQLWPIPASDIQFNRNLKQTPGYN